MPHTLRAFYGDIWALTYTSANNVITLFVHNFKFVIAG